MADASLFSSIITLVVVSVVAVIDYQRFRIPNAITAPFALTGMVFHYFNSGIQGLTVSFVGLMLGGTLLIVPYILRGFGGGDVKLLAATGAWIGANEVAWVFVLSGLLLGSVSLIMLLQSPSVRRAALLNLRISYVQLRGIGNMLGGEDRVEEVVLREDRRNRAVPFGVVLSVGLMLVVVWKCFVAGRN